MIWCLTSNKMLSLNESTLCLHKRNTMKTFLCWTFSLLTFSKLLLDSSYVFNLFTIKAQKLFHSVPFSHIKAVEWMICIWSIQMLSFGWYKIIIHNIKNLRFIWNHCCMHDHSICDAATIRGMSFNNKNEFLLLSWQLAFCMLTRAYKLLLVNVFLSIYFNSWISSSIHLFVIWSSNLSWYIIFFYMFTFLRGYPVSSFFEFLELLGYFT